MHIVAPNVADALLPALQITGKLLISTKDHDGTRDRIEEVGKNINTNKEFKEDGKKLITRLYYC